MHRQVAVAEKGKVNSGNITVSLAISKPSKGILPLSVTGLADTLL